VLTIGGVAAIDGLAGCFPRVVVRLFQNFNEASARGTSQKELDGMRELQFRICEGEKLVATWGVVGMKEAIARMWGMGDKKVCSSFHLNLNRYQLTNSFFPGRPSSSRRRIPGWREGVE